MPSASTDGTMSTITRGVLAGLLLAGAVAGAAAFPRFLAGPAATQTPSSFSVLPAASPPAIVRAHTLPPPPPRRHRLVVAPVALGGLRATAPAPASAAPAPAPARIVVHPIPKPVHVAPKPVTTITASPPPRPTPVQPPTPASPPATAPA